MHEDILDAGRQMLIRALYEELSPEETLSFEKLLEENAGLRADWEELRATRRLLAPAVEREAVSPFEVPEAAARSAVSTSPAPGPAGFLGRLRAGFRSGWVPAWSFAGATAALLVLLVLGLRVDRVDQGVVVRLGPGPKPAPELASSSATPAGQTESLDLGRYAAPGGVTALPTAATGDYLTRNDLDGYTANVMQAVSELLGNYRDEQRGELAFVLQGLYEQLRKEQRRDFDKLRARVDGVGLGLMMEQNRTSQKLESLVQTRAEPGSPGTATPSEEGNHD